jgi:hypothetical protein
MKVDFRGRSLPLAAAGLALALAACSQTTYGTGKAAGVQTLLDFAKAGSLTGEAQAEIDFTPRPPVVPPPAGTALPVPGGQSDPVLAANWPKDPDQQAAALKAEIAEANASGRRIKVLPTGVSAEQTASFDTDSPDNYRATPEQIAEYRRLLALQNGTTVDENGNPVRVFLSDPPPGYMVPDASAPPPTTPQEAGPRRLLKWPWQWFRRS